MNPAYYRPEIDGLRAVAVISVIIHHLNDRWLPGGFVGVDIFFVISGYLITSIIYREMMNDGFTFRDFYLRRIRRILPVFFVVLLATLFTGSLLLSAIEFKYLASSAKSASLFFSNMHFAKGLDYFELGAKEQPLLHTWSLSVEEQFYLVWPCLLLMTYRWANRQLLVVAILLCMFSFLLATFWVYVSDVLAKYSFFSLPTRFGELLLGALLAIKKPVPRYATAFSIIGVLLIGLSFVFITPESHFPGMLSLVPCLGAVLLIYAGASPNSNTVLRVLSSRAFVFVGLLSYSLYLWHWPIITYMRYVTFDEELSALTTVFCLLLTIVLSWLSWRFVETPMRKLRLSFAKVAMFFFIAPLVMVLALHQLARKTDGHLWYEAQPLIEEMSITGKGCINAIREDCRIGDLSVKPRVLIFGDSHSVHFSWLFDRLATEHHSSALLISSNACPFVSTFISEADQRCKTASDNMYTHIQSVDDIVIAMRWELYFMMMPNSPVNYLHYEKALVDQINSWADNGKHVYLIAQVGGYQLDVPRALRFEKENVRSTAHLKANAKLYNMAATNDNISVVDFNADTSQWANGILNGEPAYIDNNHMNLYAQEYLAQRVAVPFFE